MMVPTFTRWWWCIPRWCKWQLPTSVANTTVWLHLDANSGAVKRFVLIDPNVKDRRTLHMRVVPIYNFFQFTAWVNFTKLIMHFLLNFEVQLSFAASTSWEQRKFWLDNLCNHRTWSSGLCFIIWLWGFEILALSPSVLFWYWSKNIKEMKGYVMQMFQISILHVSL